jgi:hypothetical protein
MNEGVATAHFICNAQSGYGPEWASCNNNITVDLFNDGQYDNFNRPEGWHIELGTSIDRTVVRCPSHCVWHPAVPGERFGYWEDSPAPVAR